jgi:hypothetical protein
MLDSSLILLVPREHEIESSYYASNEGSQRMSDL